MSDGVRARTAGVVLAWLVAVGVATLGGLVAVGAVGQGIVNGGERPLSQEEISRSLAAPAPTSTPTPSPSPSPSSGQPTTTQEASKVFGSAGGTVIARCTPSGAVEVVSATPAQGYGLKDIEPEDGGQRVRFEAGHTRVEVRLTCASGQPQATVRTN